MSNDALLASALAEGASPALLEILRRVLACACSSSATGAVEGPTGATGPAGATGPTGGAGQTLGTLFFGAGSIDAHTGGAQLVPPGFATFAIADGAEGPEIRFAHAGTLGVFFYFRHVGDPANAGMTMLYEVLLNGAPLTSVTLAADVTAFASSSAPPVPVALGDSLRIRGTPSAPLNALVTSASGSVQ